MTEPREDEEQRPEDDEWSDSWTSCDGGTDPQTWLGDGSGRFGSPNGCVENAIRALEDQA